MATKGIRVLLADDHNLIRAGLRMVIDAQTDLTVVDGAENGRDAVGLAQTLHPDVAVLDISMPSLNGIETARQIRAASAGSPNRHVESARR